MTSAAEIAVDLPKPKSLKIDTILGEAAGLESFFRIRMGQVVSNELAINWAQQLDILTDYRKDPVRAGTNLQNTFLQYVGTIVDQRFVRIMSRQLAARNADLDKDLLLAYTRPTQPEWVYVEVAGIAAAKWRDDAPGAMLTLDALSGSPAGHLLRLKVPLGWLRFVAYRLGFTKRIQYPDEPRLFVGLRFMGYLKPVDDESTEAHFEDWYIDKVLKAHNVQIIKLRTRFDHDKAECAFNFDHDCWSCPKELSQCPASYLRRQI